VKRTISSSKTISGTMCFRSMGVRIRPKYSSFSVCTK